MLGELKVGGDVLAPQPLATEQGRAQTDFRIRTQSAIALLHAQQADGAGLAETVVARMRTGIAEAAEFHFRMQGGIPARALVHPQRLEAQAHAGTLVVAGGVAPVLENELKTLGCDGRGSDDTQQ